MAEKNMSVVFSYKKKNQIKKENVFDISICKIGNYTAAARGANQAIFAMPIYTLLMIVWLYLLFTSLHVNNNASWNHSIGSNSCSAQRILSIIFFFLFIRENITSMRKEKVKMSAQMYV